MEPLAISATGSGRQSVLARKGATPIRVNTLVIPRHCLEGQPKSAGRGQGQVTFTLQQPRKKREAWLLIPPDFRGSLRDVIWVCFLCHKNHGFSSKTNHDEMIF